MKKEGESGTNRIFAIDPGTSSSGAVLVSYPNCDVLQSWNKIANEDVGAVLRNSFGIIRNSENDWKVVIERATARGMPVGQETLDTCFWEGRFWEAAETSGFDVYEMSRKDVKLHLCGMTRAQDPNVRRAILDRYESCGGGKTPQIGIKKEKGPLYGVAGSHAWAALGVAITWVARQQGVE